MTCNEFALGRFQCPDSCPIWVPNPVWKCVGACIKSGDDCYLYNPLLHYADSKTNRCLPCTIPGCISCKAYSGTVFNPSNWSYGISSLDDNSEDKNVLSDFRMKCYKCANGYTLSEDGSKCVYKPHHIWSKTRTFFKVIGVIGLIFLLAVIFRLIKPNIKLLKAAISKREKLKFYKGKSLYPLTTDLNKENIAGIGLLYYFRRLYSSAIITSVLAISSLCRDGFPYSKFIRSTNVIFSLGSDGKHIFSGESIFETFDKCKDFLKVNTIRLGENDISTFMGSYYSVSIASYITVLFLTIIFAFPKPHKTSNNSDSLVIFVDDLDKHLDTEGKIEDYYESLTGIRPIAVICYDYKGNYSRVVDLVSDQNKYLQGYPTEELLNDDIIPGCHIGMNENTTLLKLLCGGSGGSIEEYEIISAVRPTGKAYLQFGNKNSKVEELLNKYGPVKLLDDIDWNSFSETVSFKPGFFIVCSITIICMWVFLFYMPHAFYSLSNLNLWEQKSDTFSAALCTTLFLSFGQMFVSKSISYLSQFINFTSKSKKDSFQLLALYSFQLVNLLLNSLVTHINRYGGQMKLFSLFNYHKQNSGLPQFLMLTEEVSLARSLVVFILPSMIIIPNFLDTFYTYLVPFCINCACVLCSKMKLSHACQLLKPPKLQLLNAYSNLLVNLTSAFFLQFLIYDTTMFFSLIALAIFFISLTYINTFLLLRHSAKATYNSANIDEMALKIWAFPTGILAACPGYWLWRMGHSPLIMIMSFIIHVGLYISFIVYIKPHIYLKSSGINSTNCNTGPLPYTTSPMHVLKSFVKLNSGKLISSASGQLESQLEALSKLDLTPQPLYNEECGVVIQEQEETV